MNTKYVWKSTILILPVLSYKIECNYLSHNSFDYQLHKMVDIKFLLHAHSFSQMKKLKLETFVQNINLTILKTLSTSKGFN